MIRQRNGVRRTSWTRFAAGAAIVVATVAGARLAPRAADAAEKKPVELLNVSYDPTRELWRDINEHFIAKYAREAGTTVVHDDQI